MKMPRGTDGSRPQSPAGRHTRELLQRSGAHTPARSVPLGSAGLREILIKTKQKRKPMWPAGEAHSSAHLRGGGTEAPGTCAQAVSGDGPDLRLPLGAQGSSVGVVSSRRPCVPGPRGLTPQGLCADRGGPLLPPPPRRTAGQQPNRRRIRSPPGHAGVRAVLRNVLAACDGPLLCGSLGGPVAGEGTRLGVPSHQVATQLLFLVSVNSACKPEGPGSGRALWLTLVPV